MSKLSTPPALIPRLNPGCLMSSALSRVSQSHPWNTTEKPVGPPQHLLAAFPAPSLAFFLSPLCLHASLSSSWCRCHRDRPFVVGAHCGGQVLPRGRASRWLGGFKVPGLPKEDCLTTSHLASIKDKQTCCAYHQAAWCSQTVN